MVGVCFAVAFSVGPPLGAYLSNYILSEKNHFQTPALFASVLVLIETIYMHLYLPETKAMQSKNSEIERTETIQIPSMILASIHFLYLFIFSGMEFTLTFLTFDLFKYSNSQQGRLLAFFGICTSFVQGGYVRRQKGKETRMVLFGIIYLIRVDELFSWLITYWHI
jgi:predicted MFS family arabinose efflux permease